MNLPVPLPCLSQMLATCRKAGWIANLIRFSRRSVYCFKLSSFLFVLSYPTACLHAQKAEDPVLTSKMLSYIHTLDSPRFDERESAVEKLSSLGTAAIRPVALQIVSGTPESVWRSKQVLESIGIRGDEETFLKSVCVLKLLFVGENDVLTQRISELEIQWRMEQKRNILGHLKSKGARVVDGAEQVRLGVNNDELLIWEGLQSGIVAEFDESGPRPGLPAVKVSNIRPSQEALREVDRILNASVEENRDRLFGASAKTDAGGQALSEGGVDPEILMQLRMQRRFGVVMGGQLIGRNREFPVDGVTLVLDAQWRGNSDDLGRIRGLPDLKRVEIDHVDLPVDQVQMLTNSASVSSIKVAGNEFSTDHFQQFKICSSLQDFEISDRTIKSGELESLGDLPNLIGLTLERVEVTPELIKELHQCKQLISIAMFEMKLVSEAIMSFAKIRSLRMLNLELCKFPVKAYRSLKQDRPELEIAFTPQALLGVRGPLNLSDTRCEIAQVVPNSGADLGGVKPGDVVLKIDGQNVEMFEDLRLHVAQHQAGEVLSLTVDRDGQTVELKIQLTPFEPMDQP
jgi:hypothetical protein